MSATSFLGRNACSYHLCEKSARGLVIPWSERGNWTKAAPAQSFVLETCARARPPVVHDSRTFLGPSSQRARGGIIPAGPAFQPQTYARRRDKSSRTFATCECA